MDIFSGKLPILKICATLPRSEITAHFADFELLTHFLSQSNSLTEKEKQKILAFGQTLNNESLFSFWQKFLPRSMSLKKQTQAIQYAEDILKLNNSDIYQFKDPEQKPSIEQFCGIDLAYNCLLYTERQLNTMLALSSQNKLNPIFYPYLMGNKNLILETDENQIRLNQMLLKQNFGNEDSIQKTIDYWKTNLPAGIKHEKLYGSLQENLVKVLITNRHRVLGTAVSHDDRVTTKRPSRPPSSRRWRRER